MMIRTSLSPRLVTPAAYLLPSAMSLSRRAATRGSTTPIRMPLLVAMRRAALGRQLDGVARVDLGQLGAAIGEVDQVGEAGLAGLLDEDRDGRLAARVRGDRLLAGLDEEHPQAVDVPLGDAVRRVEGERGLVVLSGGPELALLPERLGEPVLGLGVGPELDAADGSPRPPRPIRPGWRRRSPGQPAGASSGWCSSGTATAGSRSEKVKTDRPFGGRGSPLGRAMARGSGAHRGAEVFYHRPADLSTERVCGDRSAPHRTSGRGQLMGS